jgi:hypothetical protein
MNLSLNISVYLFKEDSTVIAYCPSLDLSGYGLTSKEAKSSFGIVLQEYLDYGIQHGTLYKDLQDHGWTINNKTTTEPQVNKLLAQNSTFKSVLQMPKYTKFSKRIANLVI